MPAPMMAPMPKVTRLTGPSARLRLCSPVELASDMSVVMDFVANKGLPMQLLLCGICARFLKKPKPPANLDLRIVGAQHAAPLQKKQKLVGWPALDRLRSPRP